MGAMKYWVWLSAQSYVSAGAKAAVAARFGDAEAAFFAPAGAFESITGLSPREAEILEKRDIRAAERIMDACAKQGIDIVTLQDARYPKQLKNTPAPPVALYVKGNLPDVDNVPAIAVVGTRKATSYGVKMARMLGYEISRCGGVVISGLTEGVDKAAAQGCLLSGGVCIGVLATAHGAESALHRDVLTKGALISEYPPGTDTIKKHFRDRNRINSGLAQGAVVVEAPEDSGALLFAAEALEQGREIFAVPGNADAPNSFGTNSLIKQGAKPVTCGWDVMAEFEYLFPGAVKKPEGDMTVPPMPEEKQDKVPQSVAPAKMRQEAPIKDIDKKNSASYIDLREQLAELSEDQLKLISAIEGSDCHIDDLIESTGMSTAKVLANLTILEIKGYVQRSAGRRISLNTKSK